MQTVIPNDGNSADFKDFAWRTVNIIVLALVDLGRRPDYEQVRRHINDIEPLFLEYARHLLERFEINDWAAGVAAIESNLNDRNLPFSMKGRGHTAIAMFQFLQGAIANGLYDPVLDGLMGAFKYDRTYYDKIVSSVGPLMEKLTTGKVAELISPDYMNLDDDRSGVITILTAFAAENRELFEQWIETKRRIVGRALKSHGR